MPLPSSLLFIVNQLHHVLLAVVAAVAAVWLLIVRRELRGLELFESTRTDGPPKRDLFWLIAQQQQQTIKGLEDTT